MLPNTSWHYYSVRIIRKMITEGLPDPWLIDEFYNSGVTQFFEEAILLVRAQSYDQACKMAERKARGVEHTYRNAYNQLVRWQFFRTIDCYQLPDAPTPGAEIYTCIHSTDRHVTAEQFLAALHRPFDTPPT